MKIRPKVAIFDVDGLILDSEKFYAKAWVDACEIVLGKVNKNRVIKWFYNNLSGKKIRPELECFNNHFKDVDVSKIIIKYKEIFRSRILTDRIDIRDGFFELVDYLISNNIRLGVASTSRLEVLKSVLKNAGVDISIFNVIVSGDMCQEYKPNPEPYVKACELLGVKTSEAVALEDSESGVMSASSAGIRCFLVRGRAKVTNLGRKMSYKVCNNLSKVIKHLE